MSRHRASRAGSRFFGLAIGFRVLAGAYAMGPISGAASNIWIYLVAHVAAAAAAAAAKFKLTEATEAGQRAA
jgi:hypothetical protein